jgi:hypothetical protein
MRGLALIGGEWPKSHGEKARKSAVEMNLHQYACDHHHRDGDGTKRKSDDPEALAVGLWASW